MTRATTKIKVATELDPYLGYDIKSLMVMLTYRRPHESKAEEKFIATFIEPLGVERDALGNMWKRIAGPGDDIMWSSHTDTMHSKGGTQAIVKKRDIVKLNKRSKANCLGADDTAGIWLMVEMIKAGKPGLYIFHRGEEVGGLGSDYIATHTPKKLDGVRAAIALDRKGYRSVITHQGSRCCSDAFADSLAGAISLGMVSDDTGLFTDTANYTHLIPECTNLSVGYERQHTAKETLDVAFLCQLLHSLLRLDTSKLVIERDPAEVVELEEIGYSSNGRQPASYDHRSHEHNLDQGADTERTYMARFLRDYAEEVAMFLQDEGYDMDVLYQAGESYRQQVRDDYDYNIPY